MKHHSDLEQLFNTIGKYHLKLNLEKCLFGIKIAKFLDFLLTKRKIKVNPNKCSTINYLSKLDNPIYFLNF